MSKEDIRVARDGIVAKLGDLISGRILETNGGAGDGEISIQVQEATLSTGDLVEVAAIVFNRTDYEVVISRGGKFYSWRVL